MIEVPERVASRGPLGALDRFLVTRNHSGAVAYLVENLMVSHGRRQRLRHSLARSLDVLGVRRLAVVRCPAGLAPERFEEPLALLDSALGPEGEPLFDGRPFEGRLPTGFIMLADYERRARGQTVVFLFAGSEESPRAVLKLRPEREGETALSLEASALDRLASLPVPLAATVPRRRAFHRLPGVQALLASVLPGRSAYVELHRGVFAGPRLAARHLQLASAWLGRFQRTTCNSEPWLPPASDDSLFDPVRETSGGLPAWAEELLSDLDRSPLPSCAGHGDFWARNLLVPSETWSGEDGDRELPGVVDWEGYRPAAPPFEDLFHFPCTYARLHPTGRRWTRRVVPSEPDPLEVFRRAFLDATALAVQVRRYFRVHTAAAGLPWGWLEPLFRLFLLTRARIAGESAGKEGSWLSALRALETAPRSVFSG